MRVCKRLFLFTIAGGLGFSFGYLSRPPFIDTASATERPIAVLQSWLQE